MKTFLAENNPVGEIHFSDSLSSSWQNSYKIFRKNYKDFGKNFWKFCDRNKFLENSEETNLLKS